MPRARPRALRTTGPSLWTPRPRAAPAPSHRELAWWLVADRVSALFSRRPALATDRVGAPRGARRPARVHVRVWRARAPRVAELGSKARGPGTRSTLPESYRLGRWLRQERDRVSSPGRARLRLRGGRHGDGRAAARKPEATALSAARGSRADQPDGLQQLGRRGRRHALDRPA